MQMNLMNHTLRTLMATAACLCAVPALAAGDAGRTVATYVAVEAARDGEAAAALQAYSSRTRRDGVALRVLLLSEIGRPGQFVLLESWRDEAAWTAQSSGAARKALESRLQPILLAPFDERLGLPMQPEKNLDEPRGALHVVLHVDVTGPGVDTMPDTLRDAARGAALTPGGIAFEVATQNNKRNHFTVHEVWASRAAYDAYVVSPSAREFRARFDKDKGAIYDDRLFTLIPP